MTRDLRRQVYAHVLELDLRFYNRTRAGQIINRLTSDTDLLRTMVTKNISTFVTSVLQVIISIWVLLEISWQLTLLALVVMPMTFAIWRRLLAPLRRGDRRVLEQSGEVTSHLQETVSGVRQVKAAAAERFEAQRFRNLTETYFGSVVRTERIRALASPLSETMGAIGTVLLLWFGGRMVVEGQLTAGAFIAFIAISLKLYQPVKWLTKFPSMVQPGLSAAEQGEEAGEVDGHPAEADTKVVGDASDPGDDAAFFQRLNETVTAGAGSRCCCGCCHFINSFSCK